MTGTTSRPSAAQLSAMVGSRMCHDLVSPLGAIGNGMELLEMSGDFPGIAKSPEMQLVLESVQAARLRVQTFRMAFGMVPDGQRVSYQELGKLLDGLSRQGRMKIELDAQADMPRDDARMIVLALMCFESAMPWGGRVIVLRAGPRWRLVGESDRIKADRALWSWLGGDAPPPPATPSEVHFPLLAEIAAENRRGLTWELDEKGGEISF